MLPGKTQSSFAESRLPLLVAAAFVLLAGMAGQVLARDLWVDHNPYNPAGKIAAGSILRLLVDEPMVLEYEYSSNQSDEARVKATPDKSLTEFLPPANADRTITGKQESRSRSRGRMTFRMGITVSRVTEDTIQFSGVKIISPEDGRTRFEVQATGIVHRQDIGSDRTIRSQDVSQFQLIMKGGPIAQSQGLPMKQNPDGTTSAAPSQQEKEQMLLNYLNRVLGEMKEK
jgi:hypothetical protein